MSSFKVPLYTEVSSFQGVGIEEFYFIVLYLQGAYGAAVLYRKKDDDSLVVLKEINLMDLSKQERNLALNEVRPCETK